MRKAAALSVPSSQASTRSCSRASSRPPSACSSRGSSETGTLFPATSTPLAGPELIQMRKAADFTGQNLRRHSEGSLQRPGSAGVARRNSHSSARRRSVSKSQATLEERQGAALVALARSMGPLDSMRRILASLFCTVVRTEGEAAFSQEEVLAAIDDARPDAGDAMNLADFCQMFMALPTAVARTLATRSGLSFRAIVGQVLWQHRGAKALEDHRSILEDLSWALEDLKDVEQHRRQCSENHLQDYFRAKTDVRGFMQAKSWREAVIHVCQNPLLRNRIWLTNADQLYFAERVKCPPGESGVTFRQFNKLLLQLAELLQVHPCIVFLAISSHVEDKAVEQ